MKNLEFVKRKVTHAGLVCSILPIGIILFINPIWVLSTLLGLGASYMTFINMIASQEVYSSNRKIGVILFNFFQRYVFFGVTIGVSLWWNSIFNLGAVAIGIFWFQSILLVIEFRRSLKKQTFFRRKYGRTS